MRIGLKRKLRIIISYINLFKFSLEKLLLGFDFANNFIRKIDKASIILILRRNGAKIGINCDIETGLIFHNCHNYRNLIVGNNCHIGKNCFFDLRDEINIGNNVVISMQCTLITHLDITKSELSILFPLSQNPIKINNNCYLGVRSTVLMGIEIGENSILAAGALALKNIPPFTIMAGVPAKIIKNIILD